MVKRALWAMGKVAGILFCLAGTLGAFIALVLVGWKGGYDVNTGTWVDVLTTHAFERPFMAFCLFFPLLMLQLDKPNTLRWCSKLSLKSWLFLLFLIGLAVGTSTETRGLYGDGREYVLQTQSMALHGSMVIDREKAAAYWNATSPYGIKLQVMPAKSFSYPPSQGQQADGNFGGLYPDRFGDYRYYHVFLYSALVAPMYKLLHVVFPNTGIEYNAFRYTNLILLCLPFLLAWRIKASWPLLIVLVLAVFSPLVAYVPWQHAEIFCFSLIVSAFLCVQIKKFRFVSPILLGLAAAQNLPAVFFFLPLAVLVLTQRRPANKSEWIKWGAAFAVGGWISLLPLLYFKYYFGVASLISSTGLADLRFASASKVFDMFFSPLIGAFWAFPVCFLFLSAVLRKQNLFFLCAALVAMIAGAFLSSSTANFMSGQICAARYMVWLLAPLWFMCFNSDGLPSKEDGPVRYILFSLGIAANVAMIFLFGMGVFWDETKCLLSKNWRTFPTVAQLERALRYDEDPEVLAETIMHRELLSTAHFNGLYVWNLGPDASVWLVSKRALESKDRFVWIKKHIPAYRAIPKGNELFVSDGKGLWLNPSLQYRSHPLLGDYVLAFVDEPLGNYKSEIPVYVRNTAGDD
jgi:hypothetical protein